MAEGIFGRIKRMLFGDKSAELERQRAEMARKAQETAAAAQRKASESAREARDVIEKSAAAARAAATDAAHGAKAAAERAGERAAETVERMKATTERAAESMRQGASAVSTQAKAVVEKVAHEADEAMDAVRETASGVVDRMREHAGAAADRATATLRDVAAGLGAGAAASATTSSAMAGDNDSDSDDQEEYMSKVEMVVNGRKVSGNVEGRTLLVHFLRENLNLTGTHVGCDTSQCGACVVHVDGKAVKSCTMLAAQASGSTVTTIEGLSANGELHPVQAAFREHHGLQCGFCTPGMIMSAVDMIGRHGGQLDEKTVRAELEGNICRCTGYHNIVKAILDASSKMGAGAKMAAE